MTTTETIAALLALCKCSRWHRDADELCGACTQRTRLTDATSPGETRSALVAVELWSIEVCSHLEHEVDEDGACSWPTCGFFLLRAGEASRG